MSKVKLTPETIAEGIADAQLNNGELLAKLIKLAEDNPNRNEALADLVSQFEEVVAEGRREAEVEEIVADTCYKLEITGLPKGMVNILISQRFNEDGKAIGIQFAYNHQCHIPVKAKTGNPATNKYQVFFGAENKGAYPNYTAACKELGLPTKDTKSAHETLRECGYRIVAV